MDRDDRQLLLSTYRTVALVKRTEEYATKNLRPKMISTRARGVVRIIHLGAHRIGLTKRSGYRRGLADAERRAYKLNKTARVAQPVVLCTVSAPNPCGDGRGRKPMMVYGSLDECNEARAKLLWNYDLSCCVIYQDRVPWAR